MHICRRLAHGVSSWLRFEFHCSRGHLFEEKYLAYSIGQILYSEYGKKVVSELDHPLLKKHTEGPGKRPKMDFAVVNGDNIVLALEAKWAGNSPLKVDDIIWDLIRLELMASHYETKCIFLLAGQKKRIKALFESKAFLAPHPNRPPRPILKDGINRSMAMRLDIPPKQRIPIIKRLVNKYPDIEMPARISSGQPFVYPVECSGSDFQVYVWQISPSTPRKHFIAKEHSLYTK